MAIVRTGQSQGALQQFTRESARLHMAVDAIRWNPFGRASIDASPSVEKDTVTRLRPKQAEPALTLHGESPDHACEVYAALGTFGALGAVIDGDGEPRSRRAGFQRRRVYAVWPARTRRAHGGPVCGRSMSVDPNAALLSEPALRVFKAGARLFYAAEAYNRPPSAVCAARYPGPAVHTRARRVCARGARRDGRN